MDFSEHNREQALVWDSFYRGEPVRMPMTLAYNSRMWLLDPRYNRGVTFEQYYHDPDLMMEIQLRMNDLFRQNLWYDWEMGQPERYTVAVDFQNDLECGQLGAQLRFSGNNVPFVQPFLHDDNKNELFERGLPDPFAGLAGTAFEYREHMLERVRKGFTWNGRPVEAGGVPGLWTDGPMTIACMLRGTTEFCVDLYEEPEYAQQLLSFLTENAFARIRAFRRRLGLPLVADTWGFADDSILLLSQEDYRRFVLPHHKRLVQALVDCGENGKPRQAISMHLCGDATRHFKTLRDELNVGSFDTGFPVDHAWLAQELGPEVCIQGGVHVDILRNGAPEQVRSETRRIIEAVRPYTKNFIMKEANNLAPCTPFGNIRAMYEAVREFGRYDD